MLFQMYAYLRRRSVSLSTKRRGEDCANLRQQLKFFLLAHGKTTNSRSPELQHKENVQKSNGGKYIYIIYWYNMSCYSASVMAVAGGAGCRVLPSSSSSASRWCDVHHDQTQTTRKFAAQPRAQKQQILGFFNFDIQTVNVNAKYLKKVTAIPIG